LNLLEERVAQKWYNTKNSYMASTPKASKCEYTHFALQSMPDPEEILPLPPLSPPERDFSAILNAFDEGNCSIPDLLLALLTERRFKDSIYASDLLQKSSVILGAWLCHRKLPKAAEKTASEALQRVYAREIRLLVKPSLGWHFSAQTAMPDDIDSFELAALTTDTAENAPLVSALLDTLLLAKKRLGLLNLGLLRLTLMVTWLWQLPEIRMVIVTMMITRMRLHWKVQAKRKKRNVVQSVRLCYSKS
jgi:hypothetical protein